MMTGCRGWYKETLRKNKTKQKQKQKQTKTKTKTKTNLRINMAKLSEGTNHANQQSPGKYLCGKQYSGHLRWDIVHNMAERPEG